MEVSLEEEKPSYFHLFSLSIPTEDHSFIHSFSLAFIHFLSPFFYFSFSFHPVSSPSWVHHHHDPTYTPRRKRRKERKEWIFFILVLYSLIISFIPLILSFFFNHPSLSQSSHIKIIRGPSTIWKKLEEREKGRKWEKKKCRKEGIEKENSRKEKMEGVARWKKKIHRSLLHNQVFTRTQFLHLPSLSSFHSNRKLASLMNYLNTFHLILNDASLPSSTSLWTKKSFPFFSLHSQLWYYYNKPN